MRRRLYYKQIQDELPFGRTLFYSYKNGALFPAGMGKRKNYWYREEVELWLKAFDAARCDDELRTLSRDIVATREAEFNDLRK